MARCPAHEDRRASLSIGEGDDGRVLIKCFAGCAFEDIVRAVGLEPRDLFSANGEGGRDTPTVHPDMQHPSEERGCGLARTPMRRDCRSSSCRASGCPRSPSRGRPRFGSHSVAGGRGVVHPLPGVAHGRLEGTHEGGQQALLVRAEPTDQAAEAGYVLIVEGESDTQTLWLNDYPALGLPGADGWNETRERRPAQPDRRHLRVRRARPVAASGCCSGWARQRSVTGRGWLCSTVRRTCRPCGSPTVNGSPSRRLLRRRCSGNTVDGTRACRRRHPLVDGLAVVLGAGIRGAHPRQVR